MPSSGFRQAERPLALLLMVWAAVPSCSNKPLPATSAGTSQDRPLPPETWGGLESESRTRPPIEDVDPSIRHQVPLLVPVAMTVSRKGKSLSMKFSTISTHLMVGHKMVTGITCSTSARQGEVEYPMGTSVSSGLDLFASPELKQGSSRLPSRGRKLMLEFHVEVFETDMPVDHLWMPEGGRHYRVLWTQSFREAVE